MRTVLFILLLGITPLLCAQTPTQTAMTRAAEDFLREQSTTLPGQTSIEVSPPPDATRYASCQHWQAFLPAGARAWGRLSVGLRCVAGGSFSLYLNARVRVEGSYLVAARPITNGQTIAAGDIKLIQGELTAQAHDLLLAESDAIGRVARTAIAPERPLQASLLRTEAVVAAGQTVKVIMQGQGFSVSNEGQALAAASLDQPVRVRLASGKIVTAVARGKGLVEVRD